MKDNEMVSNLFDDVIYSLKIDNIDYYIDFVLF